MGTYANRRKFVTDFEDAPKYTIKVVQTDTINGFVRKILLGLHGFHGCGYAAVDEGQVVVPVDRIHTHTQAIRICDIYYHAVSLKRLFIRKGERCTWKIAQSR